MTEFLRLLMWYQVTHNKCCKREGAHAHHWAAHDQIVQNTNRLPGISSVVCVSSYILTADEHCPLNECF